MARSVWPIFLGGFALFSLAGCGYVERAERPAWRTQAENLCLSRGLVKPSAYIEPRPEISGPGICGMTHPFKVSALANGAISLDKPLTIDCSMIPAIEAWLEQVVQPAAQARFGQRVVGLDAFGAYSCRSVDNIAGAQLSEHAFGNAVDVSGFRLDDGREIVIALAVALAREGLAHAEAPSRASTVATSSLRPCPCSMRALALAR